MKLTCSNCQHQFGINEKKIATAIFKVKCPKCGRTLSGRKDQSVLEPLAGASPAADEQPEANEETPDISPTTEALIRKEIATVKAEILAGLRGLLSLDHAAAGAEHEDKNSVPLGKKALVCEDEQQYVDAISAAVRRLGYSVDLARSAAEAIKKIDTGFYQMITLHTQFPDDKEGGQKILARINGQKSNIRRQMFVVLVSSTAKSADANAAFFNGANIIVNKEEIRNLEHLIREGQKNFEQIYHVFNQVLAEKQE
jgi:predicted Zn finger-like uncharacterized protein